jgi:hypothetical protein
MMPMSRGPLKLIFGTLLALVVPGADLAADETSIRRRLDEVKRRADSIPGQAHALAATAWPDEVTDPELAAAARGDLVDFGQHGFPALLRAMSRVQRRYTGDVTAVLIQARRRNLANLPPAYLPALEDAVWYGSTDARRLAIPELAAYRYGPVLMACIDAALEDPALLPLVVRESARFGDDRARFFLEGVLTEGPDALRPQAAESLAIIGGRAMGPLRDAALAESPLVRRPAIRALLPAARVDDLTVLYEYVARHGEEDAEMVERVREQAQRLEEALERQLDEESASPES